jgi:hypothetical protein
MISKMPKMVALGATAALLLVIAVGKARAADGTIAINQALVNSTGGFPYQINTSGSYVLGSNLTVPSGKDGIDINVSDVTINLNGFSIIGSGGSCTITGVSPAGINSGTNPLIHIYNGEVSAMTCQGIHVGHSSIIEHVRSFGNGGDGIECLDGCNVSYNVVNNNGSRGIFVGTGTVTPGRGRVAFNVVQFNSAQGILILEGAVANNTVRSNGSGIVALGEGGVVVTGNVMAFNTNGNLFCGLFSFAVVEDSYDVAVGGGVANNSCQNVGHNLCNGTTCP